MADADAVVADPQERCGWRRGAADTPRTCRFAITVTVEPGDPAYDDPEWAADAAAGALANVYGYECFFDDIVELVTPATGSSQ